MVANPARHHYPGARLPKPVGRLQHRRPLVDPARRAIRRRATPPPRLTAAASRRCRVHAPCVADNSVAACWVRREEHTRRSLVLGPPISPFLTNPRNPLSTP